MVPRWRVIPQFTAEIPVTSTSNTKSQILLGRSTLYPFSLVDLSSRSEGSRAIRPRRNPRLAYITQPPWRLLRTKMENVIMDIRTTRPEVSKSALIVERIFAPSLVPKQPTSSNSRQTLQFEHPTRTVAVH